MVAKTTSSKEKGETVEHKLDCTLNDLYSGIKRTVRFVRSVTDSAGKITKGPEVNQEINIEPGWKNGTKLTFEKMGSETETTTPGDVVITINEIPHSFYERKGDDLYCQLDIDLDEALNGCTKQIQFLDKTNLDVKIPKIMNSGYKHKIVGKGMPIRKNGKNIGFGDMYIGFNIKLS